MDKVMAVLLGVATLVMALAIGQMFTAASRVDALYSDVGNIKADLAAVKTTVEFVRTDLQEMKVVLNNIDTRLASALPTFGGSALMAGNQKGKLVEIQSPHSLATFITENADLWGNKGWIVQPASPDAMRFFGAYENAKSKPK